MINERYTVTKRGGGSHPFLILECATGSILSGLVFGSEYDAFLYIKENLMTESLFNKPPHPASVHTATQDVITFRDSLHHITEKLKNCTNIHEALLSKKANHIRITISFDGGHSEEIKFDKSKAIEFLRNYALSEMAQRIVDLRKDLRYLTEEFNKTL